MSNLAVRTQNLGKRFRIGELQAYRTLRESAMRVLGAPVRRLREQAARGPVARDPESEFVWALRNVDLEIGSGEIVGIIGRNGAGKSTLLKVLSRITEPTEGRAEIRGRVASLLEVGTGFHPELSGRENVFLNGAILGMKHAEIRAKFEEIVGFADVSRFLDTPVKRYSSGMRTRLAFAVAAHLDPEILIVDEVLAVGDAEFQARCLGKMDDVAQSGRTVLFVSHNMAAIERLCTRAILLENGCVRSDGEVAAVISSYFTEIASRGEASLGPLATDSTGSVELLAVEPIDAEGRRLAAAQSGRDLRLAIRLRSERKLDGVIAAVGINDAHDIRIAVLKSDISGQRLALRDGEQILECSVPRLPLVPGGYWLDVKLLGEAGPIFWAPRVATLVVEGGDFFGTGELPDSRWAGSVYLDHRWTCR